MEELYPCIVAKTIRYTVCAKVHMSFSTLVGLKLQNTLSSLVLSILVQCNAVTSCQCSSALWHGMVFRFIFKVEMLRTSFTGSERQQGHTKTGPDRHQTIHLWD